MSPLTLVSVVEDEQEAIQEQQAVLLLDSDTNRTALFTDTALAPYAVALTRAATHWRRGLSRAERQQYAQLSNVEASMTAFWKQVAPKTLAAKAQAHLEKHPKDLWPLTQLFQIDALLDKWALTKIGIPMFTNATNGRAVIVFAESRTIRGLMYQVVGHTRKALTEEEKSFPPAATDLLKELFIAHLHEVITPESLGLPPLNADSTEK